MNFSQCFARSYAEARQKFMACCIEKANVIDSWQHPLRGITGEKLYVDLAWFGDLSASKVSVLLSGTHGIEGFAGSGIQLASIQTGLHQQVEANTAVVLIHGLNPWGMSFTRRVNEAGVDLNRNFLDFSQTLPINSLYSDLADTIVPQTWTPEIQQQTFQTIFEYISGSNADRASNIAKGQYHHWYAPFYGGETATWSNLVFHKIVNKYLQDKTVVGLVDYHTGLGEYGTGQLMTIQNENSSNIASVVWGDKVTITGSSESVAPYQPQGSLIAAFPQILADSVCIAAAYEFGTIIETEVFESLRADHWLYLHGDVHSEQAQKIRNGMINAFYCDHSDWQESICNLAFEAQEELLNYLKSV